MISNEELKEFIDSHEKETYDLMLTLAQIPSPSNHEEKRAEFCKKWLESQGAEGVYIDRALNVIYPLEIENHKDLIVFMAHTDVVFPDMEPLPLKVEDGKISCPGIGDDTANVAALLLAARFLTEKKKAGELKLDCGILLVCNSGEEGLGNLKGSRAICEDFGDKIREFYSFDGTYTGITDRAVGSLRYKVEVKTVGGHSYGSFGNPNAIAILGEIIGELYKQKVPEKGKTTYNVGTISGGTSVNTIAQQAEMLYEFRSDWRENLDLMERQFETIIAFYRDKKIDLSVEVLGRRPCGGAVDFEKHKKLLDACSDMIEKVAGAKPRPGSGSTDCNIPLSMGIPAVCFGGYLGSGAHTREEFIYGDSLRPGYEIVLRAVLAYAGGVEEPAYKINGQKE